MRLIRKGNDIGVVWSIFANQGGSVVEYSLQDRNISLFLETGKNKYEIKDFTIVGDHYNSVKFTFWGKDQIACGAYFLTMVENKGEEDMRVLDFKDAFAIVRHSWETGGSDNPHITTEVVELSTNIGDIIDERLIPDTIARRTDFADYLPLDGSSTMTGSLDMGDNKITNVANPTSDYDATNKKYVDDGIAALDGTITLSNPSSTVTQSATQNAGTIIPVVSSFTLKERDGKLIEKGSGTTDSKVGTTYVDAGGSALKALNDAKSYADTKDAEINAKISTDASSSNKVMDKAYIDGKDAAINAKIPSAASSSNQLADKAWVKAVNDLVNYYKKSETYTQAEVDSLIGSIEHFHYEIVTTLPATGESNVLYLLGPKSGTSGDMYEEYVYSNGWVKIGDTSIDLSGYMPKTGGTFKGIVNMDDYPIEELGDPRNATDATNKRYVDTELSCKQDTLVSGTNIKTINGLSIIGSGELTKHLIPSSTPPSKRWIVVPQGVSVCMASTHDTLLLDSDANMNVVHVLGGETYEAKVVEYQNEVYLALGEFGDDDVYVFPIRSITELKFNKIDVVSDSDFDVLATVAVKSYQDKLVSGTNIKKFAGRDLLGSGDVTISIYGDTSYTIFPDEELNFIVWHPGGNGFGIVQTGGAFRAWNYGGFIKHICQISDSFAINVDAPIAYITFLSGSWNGTPTSRAASAVVSDPGYVSYDDHIINADTSNCVKFGEAINASNGYLTIYGDETFALMLVVVLDDEVSTYLVRGNQSPRVSVAKIEGVDSFQYAKRDDDNGVLALYHEDNLIVTPILLSGTMPTITDLASASGDEEEIQSFQIGKELPSGGTTGQVLAKASGTDYDVEWTNGGGGSSDVFWATYGTTTAQEIRDAVSAGKVCLCLYNNRIFTYCADLYASASYNYIWFMSVQNDQSWYVRLTSNNSSWSNSYVNLEHLDRKKTSVPDNRTSDTYYPTTKAVYDFSAKYGIISQTQTWSGTGSDPRTYVMSDQVWGAIPQANIDLFEAAGATFNATSGYFELNGLTDISYAEMNAIYAVSGGATFGVKDRTGIYAFVNTRTVLPLYGSGQSAFSYNMTTAFYGSGKDYAGVESVGTNVRSETADKTFYIANNGFINIFYNCYKLRNVVGVLNMYFVTTAPTTPFKNCYSLEEVNIKLLKVSLSLAESSNLSLASVVYMVQNAVNTSAITITLHATAYARAIADADVQAALQSKTNVSLASA